MVSTVCSGTVSAPGHNFAPLLTTSGCTIMPGTHPFVSWPRVLANTEGMIGLGTHLSVTWQQVASLATPETELLNNLVKLVATSSRTQGLSVEGDNCLLYTSPSPRDS